VRTIRQCQLLKLPVKDECRITSTINNEESSYDLFIMASPFYVNNIQYIILTLNDISSEKRKLMLEKIFFHDVINTAGTLRGIIDLMKDADNKLEMNKYIKLADFASNELVEEINAQRELILAENNELIIKRKPILSTNILRDVVVQILYHPISVNRSVIIDKDSAEITFTTDERILKRILINTLKNALEATPEHGKVKIGCSVTNRDIIIWVHNTGFIRREIQLQIFMRSFSTKDHNRGLGTYSMKLLTEKYLGGKISFETNEKNGTKFFIKLPI
jgi:signal transduction histidine kinase